MKKEHSKKLIHRKWFRKWSKKMNDEQKMIVKWITKWSQNDSKMITKWIKKSERNLLWSSQATRRKWRRREEGKKKKKERRKEKKRYKPTFSSRSFDFSSPPLSFLSFCLWLQYKMGLSDDQVIIIFIITDSSGWLIHDFLL